MRGGKTDLRIGTRKRGERLNKHMRVNSEPQEISPHVLHEQTTCDDPEDQLVRTEMCEVRFPDTSVDVVFVLKTFFIR